MLFLRHNGVMQSGLAEVMCSLNASIFSWVEFDLEVSCLPSVFECRSFALRLSSSLCMYDFDGVLLSSLLMARTVASFDWSVWLCFSEPLENMFPNAGLGPRELSSRNDSSA